jgi:hypothetical protein
MKVRHRLVWIAAGILLVSAIAFGQGISIDGPQGHSTSTPSIAQGIVGDTIPEGTLSSWKYRDGRQSQSSADKSLKLGTTIRYGSSIRYASGFNIRRGINHRRTFRYRIQEYSKRRFADLRRSTQPGRFTVSRSNYDSGVRYTTSFNRSRRFSSSIQYGFR